MKNYSIQISKLSLSFCFLSAFSCLLYANENAGIPTKEISQKIEAYKADPRGPYKDIRWFCADGSTVAPAERCPAPGGFQRARYKDWIVNLADEHHIFIGQILAGTTKEEFWDSGHQQSRMKQYLVEQYLKEADDGWVNRKAQFYRGAMQDEDESRWGNEFLKWIINTGKLSEDSYFLIRELAKYIPHREETNLIQSIRSLSKSISDKHTDFMSIRIKIHGNPSPADISSCQNYLQNKGNNLDEKSRSELQSLIDNMNALFQKDYTGIIEKYKPALGKNKALLDEIDYYAQLADSGPDSEALVMRTSDVLSMLKREILSESNATHRLAAMDLSIEIEQISLSRVDNWKTSNLEDVVDKLCYMSQMSEATGHIFSWELEELYKLYSQFSSENSRLYYVNDLYKNLRKNIQWGSSLITSEFENELNLFSGFEAMASSFTDDRIRSSILLYMGKSAAELNNYIVDKANLKNRVFGGNSSEIQGINPGYSRGKLIVLDELGSEEVDPDAIYVFRKPPADLEPVAGILNISEGNMVSHIQLLARNLGIPNALITESLYRQLKNHEGEEIFYAVSAKGGVMLKKAESMNNEEESLFRKNTINEEIITVPVDKIDLESRRIFSVSEVDSESSGNICGPKAANFGRLKNIFPDRLVDGMVIPFSIFREHMDQKIPGQQYTYWEFLLETFDNAEIMKQQKASPQAINEYCLGRLAELSTLIKAMKLKPEFIRSLESWFLSEFEKPLGQIPVFLRSDTNMEDLKDFTGAGLNLTLFNLVDRNKILQGIKDVWASPYSERSYKWRQKFLTNPQDVYPSILIIPSVFVDRSGVVITRDFIENRPGSLNIAFSRGVGGAVDGQKAESWILNPIGSADLVSPSRDRSYKKLSKNGATQQNYSRLNEALIDYSDIKALWEVYEMIRKEMPKAGMEAPYDIELGFVDDKLFLFQIRPFVENKKAGSSKYLSGLDPNIPHRMKIKANEKIII